MKFNSWYYRRFRAMGWREVIYRLGRAITINIMRFQKGKPLEKCKLSRRSSDVSPMTPTSTRFHWRFPTVKSRQVVSRPIFYTDDFSLPRTYKYYDFFDQRLILGQKIDWHKDLRSGGIFPKVYTFDIDSRLGKYGSVKYVWEVNRVQFLPLMAINYRVTGEQKYLYQIKETIYSWHKANPYLVGVNWQSGIEISLRLISFFLCWEILGVEKIIAANTKFRLFTNKIWLPLILRHCEYLHCLPSFYSSANNHLIAEYAGLFIASSKWQFPKSHHWLMWAHRGLEKEIARQHSEKGVNREEASGYIQFVLDLLLISYLAGEKINHKFSCEFRQRLACIFDYTYQLLDERGNHPNYGDSDDGRVCALGDKNNFQSLMISAVLLLKNPKFGAKACSFDLKNNYLFGCQGYQIFSKIKTLYKPSRETSQFYRKEGHFIFRKRLKDKEIYCFFNAAPLGFMSTAAHGHADALSLTLNIDGLPILVDPGTYTYHTQSSWRQYFVSTAAHNTIEVDNQNQATVAGPNLWLNHYHCYIIRTVLDDKEDLVEAWHDGYRRNSVIHRRLVRFNKITDSIVVEDNLDISKPRKPLNLHYHLHPMTKVVKRDYRTYELSRPGSRKVLIVMDKRCHISIVRGCVYNKFLGWYSTNFGKKMITRVICGNVRRSKNIKIITKIKILN